ncbi:hypothetical protein B0T20DRAFT_403261 [Sordaria brevicollis]|uniref:Uncharacterized protein n=1 Tax=Sordaria brevicollis TaxID=83679 RepID=A0AAE0UG06_SORBR|nr:hypothetical protein B0T20DRAFT_403261 [Sordaria brevicollis]
MPCLALFTATGLVINLPAFPSRLSYSLKYFLRTFLQFRTRPFPFFLDSIRPKHLLLIPRVNFTPTTTSRIVYGLFYIVPCQLWAFVNPGFRHESDRAKTTRCILCGTSERTSPIDWSIIAASSQNPTFFDFSLGLSCALACSKSFSFSGVMGTGEGLRRQSLVLIVTGHRFGVMSEVGSGGDRSLACVSSLFGVVALQKIFESRVKSS